MYDIDYNDSQALWQFAQETLTVAENYEKAREDYASSLKTLKIELAKAYSNSEIKESLSEDKAYLFLVNLKPELKIILEDMITKEQEYKGLEKVLEARQTIISFSQSLIKLTPK